jgi:hypothetical protein
LVSTPRRCFGLAMTTGYRQTLSRFQPKWLRSSARQQTRIRIPLDVSDSFTRVGYALTCREAHAYRSATQVTQDRALASHASGRPVSGSAYGGTRRHDAHARSVENERIADLERDRARGPVEDLALVQPLEDAAAPPGADRGPVSPRPPVRPPFGRVWFRLRTYSSSRSRVRSRGAKQREWLSAVSARDPLSMATLWSPLLAR